MASNDTWVPPPRRGKSDKMKDLRIILIGTTGTGKSATGNSLIGCKAFKSSSGHVSCTDECSAKETERFGHTLVVVDTPGVFDTSMTHEQVKTQLIECTQLASPGVHAFLLLMKIGQRNIADEVSRAFDLIKQMLGEEFLTRAIVVFTGKEILDNDGDDINEYMSTLPEGTRALIMSCEGGVVAISNMNRHDAREQAAEEIIDKVKELVQQKGGNSKYYQNVLFDERNKKINERIKIILKKNIETQNKINKIQTERDYFKDVNPTEGQRKYLQHLRATLITRKLARLIANEEIEREEKQRKERIKREKMIKEAVTIAGVVGVAACAVGAVAVAATASSPATVVGGIVTVIASSLK